MGYTLEPCTGRALVRGLWAEPGRTGPGLDDIYAGRAGCGPESCGPGPVNHIYVGCAGRACAQSSRARAGAGSGPSDAFFLN